MATGKPKVGKALSSRRSLNQGMGRGCLVLFFSVFLFMGSLFFFFFFVKPMFDLWRAQSWVATPCVIQSSTVETVRGKDGPTYRVKITYDYEYQGQPYHSERYDFQSFSSSGRKSKQAVVDKYPPGLKTTCFVNPENPAEAVLTRDFHAGMLIGLFPLIFVIVGLSGVLYAVFRPSASLLPTPLGTRSIASASMSSEDEADEEDITQPTGPRVLSPALLPRTRFFIALGIAIFWNGIVSVFLVILVQSFWKKNPEWFLAVFLIPFVLIGLGLLAWVVHSFLGLFNPRPTLTLMNANLFLGDRVDMTWSFQGSTYSIRDLKITLEGQERATYRRGTSTYTDTETFIRIPIFETTNAAEMAQGSATVEIPRRTMHSFKSVHNEIRWILKVHGSIAYWPDVAEEFPIQINAPPTA